MNLTCGLRQGLKHKAAGCKTDTQFPSVLEWTENLKTAGSGTDPQARSGSAIAAGRINHDSCQSTCGSDRKDGWRTGTPGDSLGPPFHSNPFDRQLKSGAPINSDRRCQRVTARRTSRRLGSPCSPSIHSDDTIRGNMWTKTKTCGLGAISPLS